MENTFWNINLDTGRDASDFVKLFKKSFTLYVESGMIEMAERDIEVFKNEHGEFSDEAEDFDARFCKFIFDHYLRKFHCFYIIFDTSNHYFPLLNSAHPESQASATGRGGQAFALGRKIIEKFTKLHANFM